MTPTEHPTLQAAPPGAHDWIAVTARNGDCGYVCAHCPHFADA
jgi:hypothetical protein